MFVLAIDPGKRSGWAYWPDNDCDVEAGEEEHLAMISRVDRLLRTAPVDLVVMEAFFITPQTLKKSRQPWSLEQIGAVRYLCHVHAVPFFLQAPSKAKTFATDQRLKRLGWWLPTPGGHANDALRHLMLCLVDRGMMNLEKLRESSSGEG